MSRLGWIIVAIAVAAAVIIALWLAFPDVVLCIGDCSSV